MSLRASPSRNPSVANTSQGGSKPQASIQHLDTCQADQYRDSVHTVPEKPLSVSPDMFFLAIALSVHN